MVTALPVAQQQRRLRTPTHQFYLKHKPFTIAPFMIAPVLPGETLKNVLLQSNIVTDPIKNALIGWWVDHYIFYVKHRDLSVRDTLTAMMLDPTEDVSALKQTVSADTRYYTAVGGIAWTAYCVNRIIEEYFRDEGETYSVLIDGFHTAKINQKNWSDTLVPDTEMPAGGTVTAGDDQQEMDAAYQQWQFLLAQGLTHMSYEDYLRSHGVRTDRVEVHRPELVRFTRNWQVPSNTVNPATGVPASAVRWSVAERADKDRFFTEPGFLVGLTVCRPKVYFGKQTGSVAGFMDNAFRWLPAIMRDEVYTSLAKFSAGTGPVPSASGAYWIDIRDLLLYGDQFVNTVLTNQDQGIMTGLPSAGLTNFEYPLEADVDALFASETAENVRQDGICRLSILGTQQDHT